jgi:two-component system response regulator FixJ
MDQIRPVLDFRHVVLLVDDDIAVRDSLKFTLEVAGFEVRAYGSAEQLLSEQFIPLTSCLVTDYQMPEMNGLELVTKLRERCVSVPAIIITAQPDENFRNCAAEASITILEKPILGNRLFDSILNAFVEHWKSA